MTSKTEKNIIRAAGNNERRCIARDILGLYQSIITVGTYEPPNPETSLSRDLVFKALKTCIEQHPTLSTTVQDSQTEKPQLAKVTTINLEAHVRFLEPQDHRPDDRESAVQSLLEKAHNDPLSEYETRPQWRLYIQPDRNNTSTMFFHVAFATSHALADGTSGLLFHKTFLQALSSPSTFDPSPIFEPPPQRSTLAPALERAAKLSISWSFLLGPLMKEFAPAWLPRMLGTSQESLESRPWCGFGVGRPAMPSADAPVQTAVHVTAVEPDVLQKVLAACRKHNARLTSLLNYLMCRSLAVHLNPVDHKFHTFVTETAIDLRRCLPKDFQQSMGSFASVVSETIDIDQALLRHRLLLHSIPPKPSEWAAISASTQRLAERSSTLADQPVGLLKYVSNYREWTAKRASTPADASFGMSNLGTFDGSSTDESKSSWVVKDMAFSQSADATSAPFNLNVASAKGGSLMLVATWWPGMFGLVDEKTFVHRTMEGVWKQLEVVADSR